MGLVAAVDLGTNTFRLLIAGPNNHSRIERHLTQRLIVRLGQGFVTTGRIADASVERGLAALEAFARHIERCGVDRVTAVATGVFRQAANAEEVLGRLSQAVGAPVAILSGTEEGNYTRQGVAAGIGRTVGKTALIVDIGGGSTELIRLSPEGETAISSIPIGAVYLKEKFGRGDDPVEPAALLQMNALITETLAGADPVFPLSAPALSIGTGGSITTMAYMSLGLKVYDPERIHGSRLTRDQVARLLEAARPLTTSKLQRRFHLETGRADLILFGGAILSVILDEVPEREMTVSDYGLLEGVALEMLTR
jgi:exopolyphosphatase/guanosine-5'-triphosphate,3'-diphosphate pyrophosphatase